MQKRIARVSRVSIVKDKKGGDCSCVDFVPSVSVVNRGRVVFLRAVVVLLANALVQCVSDIGCNSYAMR